MAEYFVTASRDRDDTFRLSVAGYGVTWCGRFARARAAVADLLAGAGVVLDPADRLVFRLPGELGVYLERARRARLAAVAAQVEASVAYRRLVRELAAKGGFSQADIAVILDVSPQRVSQLVRA